jgi:hypothetical protein
MFPASAPTRGQLLMLDGEAGTAPIATTSLLASAYYHPSTGPQVSGLLDREASTRSRYPSTASHSSFSG